MSRLAICFIGPTGPTALPWSVCQNVRVLSHPTKGRKDNGKKYNGRGRTETEKILVIHSFSTQPPQGCFHNHVLRSQVISVSHLKEHCLVYSSHFHLHKHTRCFYYLHMNYLQQKPSTKAGRAGKKGRTQPVLPALISLLFGSWGLSPSPFLLPNLELVRTHTRVATDLLLPAWVLNVNRMTKY